MTRASLGPVRVEIVEILNRSEQGVTRPFLCRGNDDHFYYVKGQGAGARSQLCEWMAGHLAAEFGLDLPPFGVAMVPNGLSELHQEGSDLGDGPAFASQAVRNLAELTFSTVQDVPANVRQDVLVFDWWLHNADRTLTAHGGNPNLLWSPAESRLVPIDHNQAFDPDFDPASFRAVHVFRDEIRALETQFFVHEHYSERLASALRCWDQAWNAAPPEWQFHDPEQSVPTDFDMHRYRQQLERHTQPDFWEFL